MASMNFLAAFATSMASLLRVMGRGVFLQSRVLICLVHEGHPGHCTLSEIEVPHFSNIESSLFFSPLKFLSRAAFIEIPHVPSDIENVIVSLYSGEKGS